MTFIISQYPAYDVIRAKTNSFGVKNLTAGTELALRNSPENEQHNHLHHYMISSVASSAVESNDCPLEAIERAKKNGHQQHFIFALGSCLTAHKQARKEYTEVSIGDMVYFQGLVFKIQPANNNNLHLEQITEDTSLFSSAGSDK